MIKSFWQFRQIYWTLQEKIKNQKSYSWVSNNKKYSTYAQMERKDI